MRRTAALALVASFLTLSHALRLVQRDNPRVLHAEIQRKPVSDLARRDRLRRRQDTKTLQQELDNLDTLYFLNATLGTPGQKVRLHIDTGSSDLWVNSAESRLCSGSDDPCADGGTFDPSRSSTYDRINGNFEISYVDGSGASGDYGRDTFGFGGRQLDGLQFGLGTDSTSPEGVLGIGYAANEVQAVRGGRPYSNLPQLLVDNGVIATNAYSLWLNDLDASRGSILFGGVDTEKYQGQLATLPILTSSRGRTAEFVVMLTGVGANGEPGSVLSDVQIPALLDSGSSLMYLPESVVEVLYTSVQADYDSSQEVAFVDCDLAASTNTLEFTFTSPTITVPMNELVVEVGTSRSGNPVCILGVNPAGDNPVILGDTFLRSAYVVYDLDGNTVSLAQTNFNATRSNIVEITKDGGVPDATGVPDAVTTADFTDGGARFGRPSVTSTAGAGPAATRAPGWLVRGAAAAVGGGAAVLAAL